jgi:hypothetical protein
MQTNDFEFENAIRNIVGIWHDPLTKDAYRFSVEKDHVNSAEVLIQQHALGAPLKFNYQITKDQKGLWLKIDGSKLEILKLTTYPQSILIF